MPTNDDWIEERVESLDSKLDDLYTLTNSNHIEVLKGLDLIRMESKQFQIDQMEKIHLIDSKVQSHERTFDNFQKFLYGGGMSVIALIAYFKDFFFSHK